MDLKQKIVEIHRNSRPTYGSPRTHQKLLREDYHLSKNRVERFNRTLLEEFYQIAMIKKAYSSLSESQMIWIRSSMITILKERIRVIG